MLRKHVVFDFDGTVAESLHVLYNIMNQLAPVYRYRYITQDMLPQLRVMSAQDIVKFLGINPWLVPVLMFTVRRKLQARMSEVSLRSGFASLFTEIAPHVSSVGMLSSNSKTNIQAFLSRHAIKTMDYVYTEKFRISKYRSLCRLIKKHGFDASDVCYVVDEVRDIEASRAAHVTSIAVSWGYNTHAALSRAKPDFLVDTPEELQTVLMNVGGMSS